ncbi:tola protein., putative [Eimeria necatrix]|uniref:Tola protein., putative n=1 Tax=Eimeria necatrix TaxID=51315 RepID=U6MW60_9EIME|nr:tola protein., putative [Eimeria necatrix]CDJ66724.1 tola protein., putative [Eimeria necatrix]
MAARQPASSASKGPSQLLLSSDSSSSDDLTSAVAVPKGPLATPARRGPPPPPSKGTSHAPPPAKDGSAKAPKKPAKKSPPSPTVDLLGSLYVPGSPQNQSRGPADAALMVEDPLLSIDSPSQAVKRIRSAVIARPPNAAVRKDSDAKSVPTDVQREMYQPLSRAPSKQTAAKPSEHPIARKPTAGLPIKTRGSVVGREKTERTEPSQAEKKATPSAAARGGLQDTSAVVLQASASGDAWTAVARKNSLAKSKHSGKEASSHVRTQANAAERRPPAAGSTAPPKSAILTKQQPKLPSGRGETEPGQDATAWSDMTFDSFAGVGEAVQNTPRKAPQKALPAGGSDTPFSSSSTPKVDSSVMRDLEDRLAKSRRRISELEAQLADNSKRHEEDVERIRLQLRSKLAEEVRKVRSDREADIEKLKKEEEEKREEIRKQALARQSSMKMRCDASVRELREKVGSLEQQLKAKTEEFEKEKATLMKSFEDKRKNDLQAQENEAKTHQRELKTKESELLEQQGRVQALTASMQTLTTSLAQMKELNDISRTATQALEEKAKTQAAFINTLMKREENLRAQAAKLMPIKEAKRLAFRALLKGRAVEMISRACMPTDTSLWNMAWAFQQLVDLIGGARGAKEKRQDAIESRLMQFRKEQMFLMAENERLMAKVAELQQEGVNQRQSRAALMEQALIGEAPSIPGYAFGNIHGKLGHEPSVMWLVWSVQHLVNKRMLWAFLRLQKVTTEAESNATIDKLQKKFNELRVSAYKDMAARIGVYRIASFIRCMRLRTLFVAIFSLERNATLSSREDAIKHREQNRVFQEPFLRETAATEVPFPRTSYACGELGRVDLNVPLAHQPHYYSYLPSARNHARGRNLFVPVVEPRPPVQGYMPHPGYSNTQLSLGVPPFVSKGRRAGSSPGMPSVFPSGPYDATQPVDERGAVFRMRGAQHDLRRIMMDSAPDKVGARVVGRK